MNILDDPEEYIKLITSVGLPKTSIEDSESKISDLSDKLIDHSSEIQRIADSHETHKNDIESRMSQICIDMELQKKDMSDVSDTTNLVKSNLEELSKDVNDFKDYRQNMEDYKKVTNERIEKLVKLFLSINNK